MHFKISAFLIVLFSVSLANAQSWVPNDSVPNTHANPPLATPNPGNSLYNSLPSATSGIRYGTSYSAEAHAQEQAARDAAKKQAEEAKKKHCEKKTQELADAKADRKDCDAKASTDHAFRVEGCSSKPESLTAQVPELRFQQGGSVSGSLPAKAATLLGIEIDAVISVSVSGSVIYNPAQNCRIVSGLFEPAAKETCDANQERVKAKFATCS